MPNSTIDKSTSLISSQFNVALVGVDTGETTPSKSFMYIARLRYCNRAVTTLRVLCTVQQNL